MNERMVIALGVIALILFGLLLCKPWLRYLNEVLMGMADDADNTGQNGSLALAATVHAVASILLLAGAYWLLDTMGPLQARYYENEVITRHYKDSERTVRYSRRRSWRKRHYKTEYYLSFMTPDGVEKEINVDEDFYYKVNSGDTIKFDVQVRFAGDTVYVPSTAYFRAKEVSLSAIIDEENEYDAAKKLKKSIE